ncbi:hypothetical protein BGZ93_006854 [Podila epicladia]|nr:hypothetical protein BGZ93_006854 [Podila epicladia]
MAVDMNVESELVDVEDGASKGDEIEMGEEEEEGNAKEEGEGGEEEEEGADEDDETSSGGSILSELGKPGKG